MDRDTLKFAFKCSAIERNGVWQDVYKDPITDAGKRSKRGRLDLIRHEDVDGKNTFETIRIDEVGRDDEPAASTAMRTVFQDGVIYELANDSLDAIRQRASAEFA